MHLENNKDKIKNFMQLRFDFCSGIMPMLSALKTPVVFN